MAGAIAGVAVGLPVQALAAPSGAGSALQTGNMLASSDHRVLQDKIGEGPLDRCTVDSVRPGGTIDYQLSQTELQTVYLTTHC